MSATVDTMHNGEFLGSPRMSRSEPCWRQVQDGAADGMTTRALLLPKKDGRDARRTMSIPADCSISFSILCEGHPEPYFLKCTPADCSRNYVLSTVCGVHEPSRVVFLEARYRRSRSYVSEPCVELFWSSIWRAALHLFLPCRCVPAVAARLYTCRSLRTDRWIGAC